jgi:hypothetical protein
VEGVTGRSGEACAAMNAALADRVIGMADRMVD